MFSDEQQMAIHQIIPRGTRNYYIREKNGRYLGVNRENANAPTLVAKAKAERFQVTLNKDMRMTIAWINGLKLVALRGDGPTGGILVAKFSSEGVGVITVFEPLVLPDGGGLALRTVDNSACLGSSEAGFTFEEIM